MRIKPLFETTLAEDLVTPWGTQHKKGTRVAFNQIIETKRFEKLNIIAPDPVLLNLDLAERRIKNIKDLEKIMNTKKAYEVYSKLNDDPKATAENTLKNDPDAIQFRSIDSSLVYEYIEDSMSAVVHLMISIETFINMLIPTDYTFQQDQKESPPIARDKSYIERWFTLGEKVDLVAQIKSLKNLKQQHFWQHFKKLKNLRDEIIHLKTKGKNIGIGDVYGEVYKELIDLDLDASLSQVTSMINFIKPGEVDLS